MAGKEQVPVGSGFCCPFPIHAYVCPLAGWQMVQDANWNQLLPTIPTVHVCVPLGRFADESQMSFGQRGFDRVRGTVIGKTNIKLQYFEEVFTSQHWMMRIYRYDEKFPSDIPVQYDEVFTSQHWVMRIYRCDRMKRFSCDSDLTVQFDEECDVMRRSSRANTGGKKEESHVTCHWPKVLFKREGPKLPPMPRSPVPLRVKATSGYREIHLRCDEKGFMRYQVQKQGMEKYWCASTNDEDIQLSRHDTNAAQA
eukprot:1161435-Pelagomonas_calceolata.AAC.3